MAKDKKAVGLIAKILLIVGGLNWALAIWDINVVSLIFQIGWLINLVYALVGLSALYMLAELFKK